MSRSSTTRSARFPTSKLPVILSWLHGVGGVDRIGVDGRGEGDALVDIEGLLPRAARTSDGGLERAERVVGGDVPVAAADNRCASAMETSDGIDVTVALRPEIGLKRPFGRWLAPTPFELEVRNHA
jgi:hypothetical protein